MKRAYIFFVSSIVRYLFQTAEIYRHPVYVALCTIYIPSKLYLMKIYITRNLYNILQTYSIAIKSLIVTSGSANYEIEAGNCPTCCIIGLSSI